MIHVLLALLKLPQVQRGAAPLGRGNSLEGDLRGHGGF